MEFSAVRCSKLTSRHNELEFFIPSERNTNDFIVIHRCSLDIVIAGSIFILVVGIPLKHGHFVLCICREKATQLRGHISVLTPIPKGHGQRKTKNAGCRSGQSILLDRGDNLRNCLPPTIITDFSRVMMLSQLDSQQNYDELGHSRRRPA